MAFRTSSLLAAGKRFQAQRMARRQMAVSLQPALMDTSSKRLLLLPLLLSTH